MATVSQSVPAGGGTASVTLGKQTAKVTIPAGAFAAGATLKLTLTAINALPVTFASKGRKAAQSVPTSATPLAALTIDAGGAMLLAPLQVGFSGAAAPAAGTSALVTGYNSASFNDVATTTYDGTNYNTAVNAHYPGLTLASQTLYVLYSVPTANVATPTSAITVTGPASVSIAAPATYAATETTANGFPFFGHTFTWSVDNAAVGTISATGVLSAGGIGGLGNVIATDAAVSTFSGKLAIGVTSARPGATGLTEQYTGTLSEVDANNVINGPSPAPSFSSTAQATVNVSAAQATDGSGNVLFTANESDAANLTTLTSATVSTVAYQTLASGSVNVRALKTVATESTGAVYEHDYNPTTNGLLTVLPETASATLSNDAAEVYKETDPGVGISAGGAQQVTTTRTVAGTGAYSANIIEPNVTSGVPATDMATEKQDFSGSLALNSIDSTFSLTFAKPVGGNITVTFVDPSLSLNSPSTVPSWIPSSLTQPSVETDSISAATSLDSSCTPTVGAAGPWMLTTQQLTIADAVNGTLETRTTKTYDAASLGTVCTVVTDTIQTFYDYSGQQGPYLIFFANSATQSVLTTTVTESLSLHTSNVAQVAGLSRTSQSLGGAFALLPPSMVASRVQYLTHKRSAAQNAAFRTKNTQLLRGGLAK